MATQVQRERNISWQFIYAVATSKGLDAYTGEKLRWDQISTYDNTESKEEGRRYKAKFGNLPTVDHTGNGTGEPVFRICSWKVNDAKNYLTVEESLDLCDCVLAFNRQVKPTQSKEGHAA